MTGQSPSSVLLGCGVGALGAVGAGATSSAIIARTIGAVTGAAAGGLGTVSDALGGENGSGGSDSNQMPHFPLSPPDWNSPPPVDDPIQKLFCELNPNAPNCQEERDDCI